MATKLILIAYQINEDVPYKIKMTKVDFHCHSSFSDGMFSPEVVAEKLSAAKVAYAALADHDTTEGLARFKRALAYKGIGFLSGVEISVSCSEAIGHLLAYGFDLDNPELQQTLSVNRSQVQTGFSVIIRTIRSIWSRNAPGCAPKHSELRPVAEAVDLIHHAGGLAFVPHPLTLQEDPLKLEAIVANLKQHGVDGIEAIYKPYSSETCQMLIDLAAKHELLICSGSDFHGPESQNSTKPGVDVPSHLWKKFRDALGLQDININEDSANKNEKKG